MNIPKNYIEKIANEPIKENLLEKVKDKLYLSIKEQKVLKEKGIQYKNCENIDELIYILQQDNVDDEEIEDILNELLERKYYFHTKK